jgi:PilZ domain-containing protein
MFERRTLERIEIDRLALVCVNGIRGCHPCLVVNLHESGAKLRSSTFHTAAFKFDLSLDGFRTTMHCRVVWRNGNACGVKFVDQASPSLPKISRRGEC